MAASRNASIAPKGPRNRSRPSLCLASAFVNCLAETSDDTGTPRGFLRKHWSLSVDDIGHASALLNTVCASPWLKCSRYWPPAKSRQCNAYRARCFWRSWYQKPKSSTKYPLPMRSKVLSRFSVSSEIYTVASKRVTSFVSIASRQKARPGASGSRLRMFA